MRKKQSIFATDKDSKKLYVVLKCVMTPLVALIDGLPVTFFGKGKTAYIEVDAAIGWCEKEMAYHSAEKYRKMIEVMKLAKEKFAAEKEEIA